MAKIGSGKSAGWVAITGLLSFLLTVIAQPGFLSINCGGKTNYTAENNITWVADTNYIEVGQAAYIGDATQQAHGSYLHSLRIFPKPLNKSCYRLPVAANVPYLLRLWFAVGNYTGLQNLSSFTFSFSIETQGMLAVQRIPTTNFANKDPFNYEQVLVSSGRVLYICLIRTSETNDPFISAIELRTLRAGMYQQAKPGTMLNLISRYDVGASSSVRYPYDEFDRLWIGLTDDGIQSVSAREPISTNNTPDLPPSVVMQTAWISYYNLSFSDLIAGPLDKSLLLLYFADIEHVNMTFPVLINGRTFTNISLVRNGLRVSALERAIQLNDPYLVLELSPIINSTHVILNALEFYTLNDTEPATYSKDSKCPLHIKQELFRLKFPILSLSVYSAVEVLEALKMRFGIKEWISDPCYLIPWKGIGCDNSSSVIRISEINLSARNLTGSVPDNIGELTALVNLSLENNHLTGPLPNFSHLFMLERLHLQNNNFTGTVPDWLPRLRNLKELFIENNNFSGLIPAQLLSNPSLNFRYFGNRYLHIYIPSNAHKDRVPLFVVTLSGTVVIVLVLIIGIGVRLKESRRNETREVNPRKETSRLYEDNSMIIVPNTTKSHAFTLEEIMAATQNFSQKIGQGGFGSVFFGKLRKGNDIAVKVLSLFSKQGIQEFMNEVNLLSTVHHKNLVSLLGYCNESRELMLVYEHMSGGSLRERLYGPNSELNWKTRLKIALDAAQGLEYLHMGCTRRIIHRDVKTANILLDNNLNGKLADFGLSRMIGAGGDHASHVTTIVKGTPGYLDPAYFRTQMLTEKSDVYSFGVVLLEIICGRPPITVNLPEDELDFVQWVTHYVEMDGDSGEIAVIIDKRLAGNYDIRSVAHVAKLALRCVQGRPSLRPNTSEVVAEIRGALIHESESVSDPPISEGIGYSEVSPICSRVADMKWGDNSSNLCQVGR